jgi:hypothetical protein
MEIVFGFANVFSFLCLAMIANRQWLLCSGPAAPAIALVNKMNRRASYLV